MNDNLELIVHIHKEAAMGAYTSNVLMEGLKEKDNKIKLDLENIKKEYDEYAEKTKKILLDNGINPEEEGIVSKMMASRGINKEVKKDNSDSAVSDMLIQGMTMGIIEMDKKIKAYGEQVDKEHLKLAKSFKRFQDKTIKELEKFL